MPLLRHTQKPHSHKELCVAIRFTLAQYNHFPMLCVYQRVLSCLSRSYATITFRPHNHSMLSISNKAHQLIFLNTQKKLLLLHLCNIVQFWFQQVLFASAIARFCLHLRQELPMYPISCGARRLEFATWQDTHMSASILLRLKHKVVVCTKQKSSNKLRICTLYLLYPFP